jgi:hypothetical protein
MVPVTYCIRGWEGPGAGLNSLTFEGYREEKARVPKVKMT